MAREAVKALKAERKDLVRALKTVDSVLAKLGSSVKRKARKAKKAGRKKPGPKPKVKAVKEKEKVAAPKRPSNPRLPKKIAPPVSNDIEAKRQAARAARQQEGA